MTGSKKIALLGSTGSIGRQSLDVVDAFPTQFQVVGLTAGQNITLLKKQILAYKPKWAMIHEDSHRSALRDWASTLSFSIDILETPTDLAKCLSDPDIDLVDDGHRWHSSFAPHSSGVIGRKTGGIGV